MATTSETGEATETGEIAGADRSDAETKPDSTAVKPATKKPAPAASETPKGVTVSPLALGLAALVIVLAVAATAFGFLWMSAVSDRNDAQSQLSSMQATADQNKRAEDIATKYAIGAATVDYQNL